MSKEELLTELRPFLDKEYRLIQVPKKRKKQIYMLMFLASHFEDNKTYIESDINEILNSIHTFKDCARLRRMLFDFDFLNREIDGSTYSKACPQPKLEEFSKWIG